MAGVATFGCGVFIFVGVLAYSLFFYFVVPAHIALMLYNEYTLTNVDIVLGVISAIMLLLAIFNRNSK